MRKKDIHDRRLAFVEEMGLFFEKQFGPRMAGRILGWLLVCEPEEQTAAQIGEVLKASKGSISTMVRFLIQFGVVDKTSIPGERAAYYRINSTSWMEFLNRRLAMLGEMVRLENEALALQVESIPVRQQRIEALKNFHEFMIEEIPKLVKRWHEGWERRK